MPRGEKENNSGVDRYFGFMTFVVTDTRLKELLEDFQP